MCFVHVSMHYADPELGPIPKPMLQRVSPILSVPRSCASCERRVATVSKRATDCGNVLVLRLRLSAAASRWR